MVASMSLPAILRSDGVQGVHVVVLAADVDRAASHRRAGDGTPGGVGPAEVAGGGVQGVHLVVELPM